MITIDRVLIGTPQPLLAGELSAIWKHPVDWPITLGPQGLEGDHQVYGGHGGSEKALLHYAAEHYTMWAKRFPSVAQAAGMDQVSADAAGSRGAAASVSADGNPLPGRTLFGENIITRGMTEETVCLGDRYRIGDHVVVEVTSARQPCWKLGVTAGTPEVPAVMQQIPSTGWYYRVVNPGQIAAGDPIVREARPLSEWNLARMIRGFYGTPLDRRFLEDVVALPQLSTEWRTTVERRLETCSVEDWNGRLCR
jgi:MOSC domain-containing protein YiiM